MTVLKGCVTIEEITDYREKGGESYNSSSSVSNRSQWKSCNKSWLLGMFTFSVPTNCQPYRRGYNSYTTRTPPVHHLYTTRTPPVQNMYLLVWKGFVPR